MRLSMPSRGLEGTNGIASSSRPVDAHVATNARCAAPAVAAPGRRSLQRQSLMPYQPAARRAGDVLRARAVKDSVKNQAELFVEDVEKALNEAESELQSSMAQLSVELAARRSELAQLNSQLESMYDAMFSGSTVTYGPQEAPLTWSCGTMTEAAFRELGLAQPQVMAALMAQKAAERGAAWQSFQSEASTLVLKRSRTEQEVSSLSDAMLAAERQFSMDASSSRAAAAADAADATALPAGGAGSSAGGPATRPVKIVLLSGFESFNIGLYQQVARQLKRSLPGASLAVFSDRDLGSKKAAVEAALKEADVFFGSLLFDYDQVEWLREQIERVPVRLVFESALELMSCTRIGTFTMAPGGQSKGPPPMVKKVLLLFGSGREEDKMVGYLSFLKVGPQLLKFIPGDKARDLKNWLTVYGYWNQGGLSNCVAMFTFLVQQYYAAAPGAKPPPPPPPPVETPPLGCLHPDYENGEAYFTSPSAYVDWYRAKGPLKGTGAPLVAVLLYRKHVITQQPYVMQLIRTMESEGVIPLPIFINGVEAHTVVRDLLTTRDEQAAIAAGRAPLGTLKRDAVMVDAVVSTIGFPLVGGPAGTMEGGRQVEVAKAILGAKNVPYVVAAPLLIQDMDSWTRDGVAGLQSVVLYSLPELDGAIDSVPLGGLVGDNIYLVPERVKRLAARLKKWVGLRRTPPSQRRVALMLYGFPPGVGATGTAALLNVPKSLERLVLALHGQGYDLGPTFRPEAVDGEALLRALKGQEDARVVNAGAKGVMAAGVGDAASFGVKPVAAEISGRQLASMLTYPAEWGPTEWGPIPFLPDNDVLVQKMEKQWGDLRTYRGLMSTGSGQLLVPGLQLGNVFIGVQPALGVEGDPMRLLFSRDLTPHPQYAAFYKWLQEGYRADVVLHFGMHGTVEWLPGAPLGNTGLSWSDVLLGDLPNVYLYACNNPSESIVAKRRGYGTIVSHNVPPYGRAGLYKQLAVLKNLLSEYRTDPAASESLRATIVDNLSLAGLQDDCPYVDAATGAAAPLSAEQAEALPAAAFQEYAGKLYSYLQVLENRLYSEGLHVLGAPPAPPAMAQYLSAYFGDRLPEEAVAAVAEAGNTSLDTIRARLEATYQNAAASASASTSASTSAAATAGLAANAGAAGAGSAAGASSADLEAALAEAASIRGLLQRNSEELEGLLKAMNGEYVLPEAGGDLLRDGASVLPTGRNIHALDPYRMPGAAATERGAAAAAAILTAHAAANGGALPETVAINLWGLDAIKTKGESVAMVLHMVGARPVKEGTGRIARFELVPLSELGRPRVDVLCNMSGIFRDSFQNVVELLDDLFQRAAAADEPEEMNYVRKHANKLKSQGIAAPAARLFSNPAGDYGSMVNERVGASTWDNGDELGATWASRNAFSYGRGAERGTARPEVLQALLSTTERVVQEIDSVEYGLTDIQEYYANTGALKRAAEVARGGAPVGCSIVESFGKEVKPRELEEVLRLEYRSKLLNPKWAQAMAAQGSGGAYEISQRMTAAVGWGATVDFKDNWVWDQAAATYALDEAMAAQLRASNPQAFANVLKRMLEAAGRGLWQPGEGVLEQLQQMYADLDDQLEGL